MIDADFSGRFNSHMPCPFRNRQSGYDAVHYTHWRTLSANSCVQTLATNPQNKDMLAAGGYSGDICVWLLKHGGNVEDDCIDEIPCDKTSQYGCAIGLAWMPPAQNARGNIDGNRVEEHTTYNLLSAHVDGKVALWRIILSNSIASATSAGQMTRLRT